MDVISLDEGRIKFTEKFVIKKSSKKEFETLKTAFDLCQQLKNISVPKVYKYQNGKIYMERCYGQNLELLLRQNNTHLEGVRHINYLLSYFMDSGFYWNDFAPRNILINGNKYIIMDFERGLSIGDINRNLYLIDSVYEEYSAFLLPNERIFGIDEVFNITEDRMICFSEISSNRVKKILNLLGYTDVVPLSKYALAVKMIILNEEPYKKDQEIIYPLLELEEYVKQYGRDSYAKKIIGGYNEKIRNL